MGNPFVNQWEKHFAITINSKDIPDKTSCSKVPFSKSLLKILSKYSMDENSAAIQIAPAAILPKSSESVPKPKGNIRIANK